MKEKVYTLKEEKGVSMLLVNGSAQVCPFQQPVPVKSNLGGMQLLPAACTSQCPHFNFKPAVPDYTRTDYTVLTCSGCEVKLPISQESEAPKSHLMIN